MLKITLIFVNLLMIQGSTAAHVIIQPIAFSWGRRTESSEKRKVQQAINAAVVGDCGSSKSRAHCGLVSNGFFDTTPLLAGVDANAMDHNIQIDHYTKSVYATHYDRYQSSCNDHVSTMAGRNGGLIERVPLQDVGRIRNATRALGP
jgi:hypothetical protein